MDVVDPEEPSKTSAARRKLHELRVSFLRAATRFGLRMDSEQARRNWRARLGSLLARELVLQASWLRLAADGTAHGLTACLLSALQCTPSTLDLQHPPRPHTNTQQS